MKKYIGLEDMSKVNCSNVLNVIREAKEISRKEITDITGLSWAGMSKIVNKLFEKGYIEESKGAVTGGAGRKPGVISICKESNVVIGLDINKEGLVACVLNLAGDILGEYTAEADCLDKEVFLQSIISFTSYVIKENNKRNILAIGVAMQGIINVEKGISERFPDCKGWENVPIREILINHFHYPVFIEHDPNCMLYSAIYNHPTENCILFRIDRSIGMAVTMNGNIICGNGMLEVAHSIIVPDGKQCKCGKKGCVEAYLKPCLINKKLQMEEVDDMVRVIAILMYNMVQIFNARKLILTGEMIAHKNIFQEKLLKEFYSYFEESSSKKNMNEMWSVDWNDDEENPEEIIRENGQEKIEVDFMEETKRVVFGAAMIAVQGAIDEIEI